jgi:hypothetical protein
MFQLQIKCFKFGLHASWIQKNRLSSTSIVDIHLSEFINIKNLFLYLFYIYLTPVSEHNKCKQTTRKESEIVCVHGVHAHTHSKTIPHIFYST